MECIFWAFLELVAPTRALLVWPTLPVSSTIYKGNQHVHVHAMITSTTVNRSLVPLKRMFPRFAYQIEDTMGTFGYIGFGFRQCFQITHADPIVFPQRHFMIRSRHWLPLPWTRLWELRKHWAKFPKRTKRTKRQRRLDLVVSAYKLVLSFSPS